MRRNVSLHLACINKNLKETIAFQIGSPPPMTEVGKLKDEFCFLLFQLGLFRLESEQQRSVTIRTK